MLAGDQGFVKVTFGEGERGELTDDHGLVKAICGDGEGSSYLSSAPVSVEESLVVSVSLYSLGRIFLSCGRTLGVWGVRGLPLPDDGPEASCISNSR